MIWSPRTWTSTLSATSPFSCMRRGRGCQRREGGASLKRIVQRLHRFDRPAFIAHSDGEHAHFVVIGKGERRRALWYRDHVREKIRERVRHVRAARIVMVRGKPCD